MQNVILTGGGSLCPYFGDTLKVRARDILLRHKVEGAENLSVTPLPREIKPEELCWKGASIITQLEAAQDLWTDQAEWRKTGFRAIKEKLLFRWE